MEIIAPVPSAWNHIVSWRTNPFRYTWADFFFEEKDEEEVKQIEEVDMEEFAIAMQQV